MERIRLSPTNLDRWFTLGCPAAWDFNYRYSLVEPNPYAQFGNDVHACLEGPADRPLDQKVVQTAGKLWAAANMLGLSDLDKPIIEKKQEWKLRAGITFVRKLDRIMLDAAGEPVIVDWKTHAGYGWKQYPTPDGLSRFTPQSMGTQTAGYFLKPPKKILAETGLTRWPTKMYYIVAPARGVAQIFYEEQSDDADANFQTLLTQAAQAILTQQYPKVHGKHCSDCEFFDLCFQNPGYAEKYAQYR